MLSDKVGLQDDEPMSTNSINTLFKCDLLASQNIVHIKSLLLLLQPNISSSQVFTSPAVVNLSSRWKMNSCNVCAFASLSMRCVILLHGPVGRTDQPVNQKQRLIWPLGVEHKAQFTTAALLTSAFSKRLIISYWPLWRAVYDQLTNVDGKACVFICVSMWSSRQ